MNYLCSVETYSLGLRVLHLLLDCSPSGRHRPRRLECTFRSLGRGTLTAGRHDSSTLTDPRPLRSCRKSLRRRWKTRVDTSELRQSQRTGTDSKDSNDWKLKVYTKRDICVKK